MPDQKMIAGRLLKYDESLGLVLGYAIVCKEDGEPYFDLQGDHIPETAMLKAATDFMLNGRLAGEMHAEDADGETIPVGKVVFAWPETEEVSKAFGLEVATTGLKIAIKPNDDTLAKVRSGELAGFSIGGERGEDEPVDG